MSKCYLAGGCFWCIESVFDQLEGINNVTNGYCGDDTVVPSYELVKSQKTNFREALEISFTDYKISFEDILDIYFENVDIYDDGGQFIDRGHSYTLAIYYVDEFQKEVALRKLGELFAKYGKKPAIALEKYSKFYDAEEYHQKYYLKNPQEFEEELKSSGRKKGDA